MVLIRFFDSETNHTTLAPRMMMMMMIIILKFSNDLARVGVFVSVGGTHINKLGSKMNDLF